MIKFVTPEELPGVRSLLKECFGFDEAGLDLYLERNPAPRRMCCVEDGRVVAFLAAFPVDYVSGELVGGFHRTWHGYYLHGMCTAPGYRNRGIAAALMDFCATTTGRDGWEFLLAHPQGDALPPEYLRRHGFSIDLTRRPGLPDFEYAHNITGRHAGELFLQRFHTLRCNYFQWSAPMLHYIIRLARLSYPDVTPGGPGLGTIPAAGLNPASSSGAAPYAMLRLFGDDFRLSSPDAVFSYPLDLPRGI